MANAVVCSWNMDSRRGVLSFHLYIHWRAQTLHNVHVANSERKYSQLLNYFVNGEIHHSFKSQKKKFNLGYQKIMKINERCRSEINDENSCLFEFIVIINT